MKYETPVYLPIWIGNASFIPSDTDMGNFPQRLRIASCIEGDFAQAALSSEIAFASMEGDVLIVGNGLEYFLRSTFAGTPAVLVDNHNHVLYFWYEALKQGIIGMGATLIHIDMHSDLWENSNPFPCRDDLGAVWKYVNYECNVWNYIIPAKNDWLIGEVVRIEGEQDLLREIQRWGIPNSSDSSKIDSIFPKNSILNLDLDFFSEELDDISFEMKRRVIQFFASRVAYITLATSPFFIPWNRALEVLGRLLKKE